MALKEMTDRQLLEAIYESFDILSGAMHRVINGEHAQARLRFDLEACTLAELIREASRRIPA